MKHLKFLLILLACAFSANAQQKISERTTLAGASIDTAADWIPIVDTSAGTSGDKKTSLVEMWKAIGGTNVSSTELGYLDGVTSAIQTQIDAKAASSHTHSLSNLTQSGATSGQVPTWNGSAWAAASPSGGSFSSLTGEATDNTSLSTALGLKVDLTSLSTTGGANKVPKLDSNGDLITGTIANGGSLGTGGNVYIPQFRYLGFMDSAGTVQTGIYLWPNHSGGHEMVCTSQRWCFYWSGGFQMGSPATARDGRHLYIQPNSATASDTIVESPPVSLDSRYWNGSASVSQNTWLQVVPTSAAANTEVLNLNFGGTVGSDHRLTGGVTPVKINRSGILAAGTIQGGTWNGDAITDSYISAASSWSATTTTHVKGILANSQTITGTTTYADVTGVTISLPVGTYVVDSMAVTTQANGTMGSKVQLVASGTGVVNTGWTKMTANGLTHQPEYSLNYGSLSWSEGRSVTSSQPCIFSAKFVVVVTSGTATIKMQAAQATSDAGNLTVLSGAMIRAEKQ